MHVQVQSSTARGESARGRRGGRVSRGSGNQFSSAMTKPPKPSKTNPSALVAGHSPLGLSHLPSLPLLSPKCRASSSYVSAESARISCIVTACSVDEEPHVVYVWCVTAPHSSTWRDGPAAARPPPATATTATITTTNTQPRVRPTDRAGRGEDRPTARLARERPRARGASRRDTKRGVAPLARRAATATAAARPRVREPAPPRDGRVPRRGCPLACRRTRRRRRRATGSRPSR